MEDWHFRDRAPVLKYIQAEDTSANQKTKQKKKQQGSPHTHQGFI